MKRIDAYIQPHALDRVTRALLHVHHLPGMTVLACRGFGREKLENEPHSPAMDLEDFVQKTKLEIVCHDHLVDDLVDAIRTAAQTGNRGDGKIFVLAVESATRIRTGETGEAAVASWSEEHAEDRPERDGV